jgi:hypothetical protein
MVLSGPNGLGSAEIGKEVLPGRGSGADRDLGRVMPYITAGANHHPGSVQARAPQVISALHSHASGRCNVPGVGENVEEVDPDGEVGWERAKGQMAVPRHIRRCPRRPRCVRGRAQREAVITADEITRWRLRVIGVTSGEAGEL